MFNGRPKYVTAMSETNEPYGWRANKATSGCIIDVATGQTITRGLSMPHSPRCYAGRLWVLDSGKGHLNLVDPQSGHIETVTDMPGFTRGLSLTGPYAFVGLSRIRETSTFGGLPLESQREELRCGVGVIDLGSGRTTAVLKFLSGVEEIFAVEIVPNSQNLRLLGPVIDDSPDNPGQNSEEVWLVPSHGKNPPATLSSTHCSTLH
jgi:uncharacterized protein (TIGR03032 family)